MFIFLEREIYVKKILQESFIVYTNHETFHTMCVLKYKGPPTTAEELITNGGLDKRKLIADNKFSGMSRIMFSCEQDKKDELKYKINTGDYILATIGKVKTCVKLSVFPADKKRHIIFMLEKSFPRYIEAIGAVNDYVYLLSSKIGTLIYEGKRLLMSSNSMITLLNDEVKTAKEPTITAMSTNTVEMMFIEGFFQGFSSTPTDKDLLLKMQEYAKQKTLPDETTINDQSMMMFSCIRNENSRSKSLLRIFI